MAEGGRLAKLAFAVTATAFVFTGDIPWAIILTTVSCLHLPKTELSAQLVNVIQVVPVPIILLVVSVFYLCVYMRCTFGDIANATVESTKETVS